MSKREVLFIALEVVAGLWGSGSECHHKLMAVYSRADVDKIQNAVNCLIGVFRG